MFRFTITELKYRTLCVRKTWRSFLSLLPQMSHLSQSVEGKMIFWRPVWSPGVQFQNAHAGFTIFSVHSHHILKALQVYSGPHFLTCGYY